MKVKLVVDTKNDVLLEFQKFFKHIVYGVHFQFDWFHAYIKYIQFPAIPYILKVFGSKSRDLQGGLLLNSENMRGTRLWNSRQLVPLGIGPSDFYCFLCLPGEEKYVAVKLASWFRCNWSKWDYLYLDLIPQSSSGWQEFIDAMERVGFMPIVSRDRCFYKIDANNNWDTYEKDFLHGKLSDLRNRRNRLTRSGIKTEVKIIENGISNYLDGFIQTYQQRRRTTSQPSIFDKYKDMRQFLEAVIKSYEEHGWVRLSMLTSDEAILAYQLDWIHNGVWYHYMPAFNEQFAEYSPGKILLYETIKMAFADPEIHEFNFMRGQSAYKTQFAYQSEPFISIKVENPHSLRIKATRTASKLADWRDRFLS